MATPSQLLNRDSAAKIKRLMKQLERGQVPDAATRKKVLEQTRSALRQNKKEKDRINKADAKDKAEALKAAKRRQSTDSSQ